MFVQLKVLSLHFIASSARMDLASDSCAARGREQLPPSIDFELVSEFKSIVSMHISELSAIRIVDGPWKSQGWDQNRRRLGREHQYF